MIYVFEDNDTERVLKVYTIQVYTIQLPLLTCVWLVLLWLIYILAVCGKCVREAKRKFTQYEIMHTYYHTPVRLHCMCICGYFLCQSCAFFFLVQLFLWLLLCVYCKTCPNRYRRMCQKEVFSVIMVGLTTATRILLMECNPQSEGMVGRFGRDSILWS